VIGAFLHSLFLMVLIVILYFDFKKLALISASVFLAANAGLTFLTTRLSTPFYGYGYLVSAFLALAVSFYLLDHRLKSLEFYTFAPQPVGAHREEEPV